MLKKIIRTKNLLIILLIFTAITRLYNLNYPNTYIFDEVYHGFTAKEYLKGNKEAWSPWGKSEPGVAFEWLHPPISKEIMTASMFVLGSTDAWAWRLPGILLGVLSVFLVYKLGLLLFKKESAALISAFVFSIDGLNFVQSRTGMNDAYLVAFVLTSIIFFLKEKYILSALFMGAALATKWPGIFLALIYFPILWSQRSFKRLSYFILIPLIIYLLSYLPYFLIGYGWTDFVELHQQIWWYQTNLKATHDYASPWWSWPLNLYPVWYFVDYQKDKIANIFASGNPLVFWFGTLAIILTAWEVIKGFILNSSREVTQNLLIILAGFFIFWLPWAVSPRIMFLYHFSPAVPFLSLALGYQLNQLSKIKNGTTLVIIALLLMIISFLFLYPFLTGIPLPKDLANLFFLTNLSKNPF